MRLAYVIWWVGRSGTLRHRDMDTNGAIWESGQFCVIFDILVTKFSPSIGGFFEKVPDRSRKSSGIFVIFLHLNIFKAPFGSTSVFWCLEQKMRVLLGFPNRLVAFCGFGFALVRLFFDP